MQGKVSPKPSETFGDGDTSYEAFVKTMSRRANMQQQIAQNLIKVKYIKEEDRLKELRKAEAEAKTMKSNASIDSLEEIM